MEADVKFHLRGAVAVGLAAALALTGCSPGSVQSGGASDTLTMSLAAPVDTMDPTVAYQTGSFAVLANIFQTLVTLDPKGGIVPGLATEYDIDPQQRTIEFTLDPEAKFSNGTPVTAADVAFSVDLWKESASYGSWYSSIASVSMPDPHTAVLHLTSTGVAVLRVLAIGTASVIPQDFAGMSREEFFAKPIGSGPYAVESARLSEAIVVTANPDYSGRDNVFFKTVEFNVVPDANQRQVQFRSKQLDIVSEISPIDAAQYPPETLKRSPSFWQDLLIANARDDVLSSVELRRAISMAIDREALVATVYKGEADSATTVAPQVVPGVTACQTCDWGRYDVEEAKRLVSQSGYTGQPITILTGGGSTDLAGQALVPMLQAAGITATVEKIEGATQTDRLTKGEYELALIENTALAPTPLDPVGFLADTENYYAGDDSPAARTAVQMLDSAQNEAELQARKSVL
ncbi:MAG: ABC transporter substrate-binding protein [Mycobacterium sp.]|nr:ABC transporter substrate-binding protein [Mycobacterium sp.]